MADSAASIAADGNVRERLSVVPLTNYYCNFELSGIESSDRQRMVEECLTISMFAPATINNIPVVPLCVCHN